VLDWKPGSEPRFSLSNFEFESAVYIDPELTAEASLMVGISASTKSKAAIFSLILLGNQMLLLMLLSSSLAPTLVAAT
jgi:hypothetical protein